MEKRDIRVDISRGLSIYLIVLGHTGFSYLWLFSLFFVQVFFFISGFFLKDKKDILSFIMPKVKRILFPYVFFFIMYSLLCLLTNRHNINEIHIYDPDSFDNGPMWFLVALFTSYLMYYQFQKLKNKLGDIMYVIGVISFFFFCYYKGLSGYDDYTNWVKAGICFPFIVIGKICYNRIDRFGSNNTLQFALFVLSVLGLLVGHLYFGLSRVYWIRHLSIPKNPIIFLISSFCGIYLLMIIGRLLGCVSLISKLFSYLGRSSLYILCMHWPFIKLLERYVLGMPDVLLFLYALILCLVTAYMGKLFERYFPLFLNNK